MARRCLSFFVLPGSVRERESQWPKSGGNFRGAAESRRLMSKKWVMDLIDASTTAANPAIGAAPGKRRSCLRGTASARSLAALFEFGAGLLLVKNRRSGRGGKAAGNPVAAHLVPSGGEIPFRRRRGLPSREQRKRGPGRPARPGGKGAEAAVDAEVTWVGRSSRFCGTLHRPTKCSLMIFGDFGVIVDFRGLCRGTSAPDQRAEIEEGWGLYSGFAAGTKGGVAPFRASRWGWCAAETQNRGLAESLSGGFRGWSVSNVPFSQF